MIKRVANWIVKLMTKNYTQVPLFVVDFDYKKFAEEGKPGSCMATFVHPDLRDDEFLKRQLQEAIDYIRDNYNMEKIVKF